MRDVTVLRTSVRPPYAAHLRVYEPLAAFREPERSYWQGYAAERLGPSAVAGATALEEGRQRLADLIAVPPVAVPEQESRDAFVHAAGGVTYLCPWRTRLRSWMALEELQELLPPTLLDAVVPQVVRQQAEADWDRWRAQNPDGRPWILTSTWHVPVRWLLLFGPEEREFAPAHWQQDPAGADGEAPDAVAEGQSGGVKRRIAPVMRYRTPMAQARRRVARGYRVLREALDDGPMVAGVEQVGRWLEEFHPRSLVELDYGGLVNAISEEGLAEDSSVQDVADGIAALRAGDGAAAGRSYRAVTERWRRIQELQYAN
ncbi:hypothetical protein [Streptacidiphilus cavernicola]|uniref:DUF8083 domain-containing protein n=1 Tax=Streptacidiphilus cavernicola TaxID=3342716 RepID=A0ABV6VXH1_9ACTN